MQRCYFQDKTSNQKIIPLDLDQFQRKSKWNLLSSYAGAHSISATTSGFSRVGASWSTEEYGHGGNPMYNPHRCSPGLQPRSWGARCRPRLAPWQPSCLDVGLLLQCTTSPPVMCWRRGNRVRKKSEGIQRWILLQEKKPSHIELLEHQCREYINMIENTKDPKDYVITYNYITRKITKEAVMYINRI
jgi:hypothetical protein